MSLVVRRAVAFFGFRAAVGFSRCARFLSASQAREPSTLSELLLDKHQLSPEAAAHVSSALPRLKNLRNPDSVITYLKSSGFSTAQVEKVLKHRPRLLSADVERSIEPKLKVFRGLGFSSDETAELISSSPMILYMDADKKVAPALSMLKDLMGSNADVSLLMKKSQGFLISGSSKNLPPNIEYLKSCGARMEGIRRLLRRSPRIFLSKPEQMRKYVEIAEKRGVNRGSNMFVHAIEAVGSMSDEVWELKVRGLRKLGFCDRDLLEIFSKAPQVLSLSLEKVERIRDLLLSTGNSR